MFTTDVEGTRVCATIRGASDERAVFLPRGRLPAGVVMTLGSSNTEGTRRLEIRGTNSGNQHSWFVDGRERNFDAAASDWRDAMLDLVGTLTERNAAEHARAVEAMGVARRNAETAASDVRRAQLTEMRATTEARAADVRAAGRLNAQRAREMEVAGRAMAADVEAMGRHAGEVAEVAKAHARAMHEVAVAEGRGTGGVAVAPRAGGRLREVPTPPAVAGVREVPVMPRVAGGGRAVAGELRAHEVAGVQSREREIVEAHRVDLEQRRVEMREHAADMREHAADLAREHARMAAELDRERPVVARGRGVGVAGTLVTPRAVPSMREAELDPRAADAAARLRRAIRVTGET
jgi:hypothetical protein